ncbi:ABC transporter ATP-binding protein [Saccharibacillus sp. CPCC 101409]|uniref:ABC transporter ATP-binding protein n=1 Tax=Saccharibacillus sp. CPCC 101409 TaxID=3058041 RepID=UPI00267351FE|nr:ABC transporter ATP-binding protein [Saccharibacillus sp. CPCC 101409]MDO3412587.1 ABC transporter ATP-binding protein [Saccharibacillus sp. CPCC 101409]
MSGELALQTRGLNKSFGKRRAVGDLNLHVERGDIYGFLGPNGAGKTTTIRMLLGLIAPDSGDVELNGIHVRRDFKKAISTVGAMLDPSFYGYLSGYENLKLIAKLTPGLDDARIREALDLVQMSDRARDKVKTYSLGMKQRLGIAGALLNNPGLVILDEPTNGLDPQGIAEIRDTIVRLAAERGITFFISSHLLHEVEQICTRVGIVKNGRLLVEDRVERLLVSDSETFELHTPDAGRALELARGMQGVRSASAAAKGIRVELAGTGASELNRALVAQHVAVEAMIPQSRTLEQFFFDIQKAGERHEAD